MTNEITTSEQPRKEPTEAQRKQWADRAAKSTGPRTEEGKARSSRNAWKHGLTSAASRQVFQNGAASMAKLFGKPCRTTCPIHPDNPELDGAPCGLVVGGMTSAGGNCLDKTVYVHAYAALLDGMEGAMEGMQQIMAAEGAAALQLIHELRSQITDQGISIPQYAVNKEGNVVCRPGTDEPIILGYSINPAWGVLLGMIDKMGISLPEMLATPAARSRAKLTDDTADALATLMGTLMQRSKGAMGVPALPSAGGEE